VTSKNLPQLDTYQLFEAVPCYVTVQDRDLRLLHANKMFCDDFGAPDGRYCFEAYKHRDEPCLECQVIKSFADGLMHSSEEQVKSKDGSLIHMIVYTTPLRNASDEIYAVMEMSTNITEVRKLQTRLASLGQFVASTAHNIKNIVTSLEGGVYVVDSGFTREDSQDVQKGWSMVKRNVERIADLAHDLLYYAKDRKPMKEPFAVVELLTHICELYQEKAGQKNIKLETDLSEDISAFCGDRRAIHSMLSNIITNAVEACMLDSDTGKTHHIRILSKQDDDQLVVEIVDNGIGMSNETVGEIFEMFYSTKASGGTGLGLMIARKVAREHGGDIQVASSLGEGASFKIILPMQ